MKKLLYLLCLALILSSCNRIKQKTKETINKSGEAVGKTAAEFGEGVATGVRESLKCDVIFSEELINKGLDHGKYYFTSSDSGRKDVLNIYLIFDKDFKGSIIAKAIDKNNLEYGRSKIKVEGKKDDAFYFDFVFDERTKIESKSVIHLELSELL